MDDVLAAAIEAAKAAGKIALKHFRTALTVETKADGTPVTEADRRCEEKIVETLARAFPEAGFLGEEMGEQAGRTPSRWIIDPIDGTKNFVRGIPFFATLIALEEAGEITAGVIHAPASGDLLYARKGQGAFADGRRARVSTVSALGEAMLIHGGLRDLMASPYWAPFLELAARTARQRGFGDALGHIQVIRGSAEVVLEPEVKAWDLAATKIIVEEAGGRFSDLKGSPSVYNGTALISNGRVHDAVLEILKKTHP
jgi:histidinol-phosphatase